MLMFIRRVPRVDTLRLNEDAREERIGEGSWASYPGKLPSNKLESCVTTATA